MATVMAGSSKGSCSGYSNYLLQEEKTEITLVETKDCTQDFARDFDTIKNIWDKNKGVQFHEIVQSFKPGEVTAEQAHEIGKKMLDNPKFKDFQVVLVTHKDRDHIHNHIVINSVSHIDGKKYHQTPKELKEIKQLSNELCKERELSYLNLDVKAEKFINQKEQKIIDNGGRNLKEELREYISEARDNSKTLEEMQGYLKEKYNVEMEIERKNLKFKHPENEKFMRGSKLGGLYEKENIENGLYGRETKEREPTIIGESANRNKREIGIDRALEENKYSADGSIRPLPLIENGLVSTSRSDSGTEKSVGNINTEQYKGNTIIGGEQREIKQQHVGNERTDNRNERTEHEGNSQSSIRTDKTIDAFRELSEKDIETGRKLFGENEGSGEKPSISSRDNLEKNTYNIGSSGSIGGDNSFNSLLSDEFIFNRTIETKELGTGKLSTDLRNANKGLGEEVEKISKPTTDMGELAEIERKKSKELEQKRLELIEKNKRKEHSLER